MPSWEIVKKVNSKLFTFEHAPKLPGSEVLHSEAEVLRWIELGENEKVVKTCFGLSSRGNFCINRDKGYNCKALSQFLSLEFSAGRVVLGEPWMNRLLDFSTQWEIAQDGVKYLGATKLINHASGKYIGTLIDDEEEMERQLSPFLQEHLLVARELLQLVLAEGYLGYAGLDAMVYKSGFGSATLHPIVELNGRMTMGLAALLFRRRFFPKNRVLFSFESNLKEGWSLLPESIQLKKGLKKFKKELRIVIIDKKECF